MASGMGGTEQTLKLILVGNGSAGKTSICARFREDGFRKVYKQTVGIDFYEKTLRLRGRDVGLQVWDIGGQSIGSKMLWAYVSGAAVVFLCYDVTDPQSFADAEDWLTMVRRTASASGSPTAKGGAGSSPSSLSLRSPGAGAAAGGPTVYLVGNKGDLEHLRKVTQGMHDRFVAEHGLAGGFVVSARSGDGVVTAFYSATAAWLGVQLSDLELELTKKVLAVTVAPASGGEGALPGAADIEAADRAAEAAKNSREKSSCCVVQ